MGEDAKQSWQWLLCSCRVVTQAKAPGDSRWPLAILVPGPCPHRSYGHLERAHSKFCSGLQQCWECVWRGARGPWTCHFLILAVPLLSHSCILGMQEAGRGLSFPTQPAPMDGTLARGVSMYTSLLEMTLSCEPTVPSRAQETTVQPCSCPGQSVKKREAIVAQPWRPSETPSGGISIGAPSLPSPHKEPHPS